MFKSKYFKISVLISAFFGLLPTLIVYIANNFKFPFVPIEIADDTLYYLSRIREVLAGNLFIGNPYIIENITKPTTAFFVGDWIYSFWFWVFSFFNLPVIYSFLFSQFFWSIVLGISLFILYKKINVDGKYIPFAVSFSFLTTMMFIWRPVAMAVVFPCFIFFLISLFDFIKNKYGKKERTLFVLSGTLCFYVYTYLWQIVLVILFFLLLHSLYLKKDRIFLLKNYFLIFLFSVPVFIYTYIQIKSPFYFETLQRVGLVNTHTIGVSAILYITIILFSFLLIYLFKDLIEGGESKFFILVFIGLLFTSISNVFSGKDLETAVHIGRFIEIFISIFIIFLISVYDYKRPMFSKIKLIVGLISFSVILIYSISLISFSRKVVENSLMSSSADEYKTLLKSINTVSSKPIVIFSDDRISSYIPVMTKNYVLFHPNAELYLSSNKEIEDRYLLSRVFSEVDQSLFKSEYRKYRGVGNALHKANIVNRKVKFCLILKKIYIKKDCGDLVTMENFVESGYFENLFSRFKDIEKNKEVFLDKYNVSLIIVDVDKSGFDIKEISSLKNFELAGSNGRFVIFKRK